MGPSQVLVRNRDLSWFQTGDVRQCERSAGHQVTWRREWDSNPRAPCGATRFRDELFRPLRHLSTMTSFSTPRQYEPYECAGKNPLVF